MSIVLQSTGGGSVTLQEPSTASTFTQTLPSGTGTVVVSGINSAITAGTAVSASGTSVDFTGIPSWVRRITVMFSGVSTNGTSGFSIQLGTSGGIVSSGYSGGVSVGTTYNANSSSFFLYNSAGSADLVSGNVVIALLGSNVWCENANLTQAANGATRVSGGSLSLGGTLTTVRIVTANGTDAFDAGTINILYE